MTDNLLRDLRLAARTLLRRPAFSAMALLLLALGIGAAIAIFSVFQAVLLAPLPYPEPDELVRIYQAYPERGQARGAISQLDADDWQRRSELVGPIGLYSDLPSGLTLLDRGEAPRRLRTAFVSGDFFTALATQAAVGRTLTAADEGGGSDRVVVLSHRLWQRRFGADEGAVGRAVTLNGEPYTVAGVMPPEFAFPDPRTEAWVLLSTIPEDAIPRMRFVRWLGAVGRLEPGADAEAAQGELSQVAAALAAEYPDSNAAATAVTAVPLKEMLVGDSRPSLVALAVAVSLLLLIACANVANLLLARGLARQREIAVRSALGASRLQLVRQLLSESLLLCLGGGALGLGLARWGVDGLLALAGDDLPRAAEVGFDGGVLLFALAASLVTGLLCGLMPALRLAVAGGGDLLRGRGGDGRRWDSLLRRGLVAAEAALAVLLLIGAGLVVRSLGAMTEQDPGFALDDRLAVNFTVPLYKHSDRADYRGLQQEIIDRVARVPGVERVAALRNLPFDSRPETYPFYPAHLPEPRPGEAPNAEAFPVTPGIFRALGIPLLDGRGIEAADRADMPSVVVVNETLAREHFHDRPAVGSTLMLGGSPTTIVGVVGDARHTDLTEPPEPAVYLSYEHISRIEMTLIVVSPLPPEQLAPAVRAAIWQVEPELPIDRIEPLAELARDQLGAARFLSLLVTVFALIALLLAAGGLYGVVAFTVGRRRREIGVRVAVGAARRDVVALVLRQGLTAAALGIGLGVAVALASTRALGALLYQVSATDPLVFTAVPLLLLTVALAAAYLPARKAAAIDPVAALKEE